MKIFRALWNWIRIPTKRYGFGAIMIAGFLIGVSFWGIFNTFAAYTNTLEFCTSCHEMEANPYREYKFSTHYSNASGVRAICSDCHVPKEWTSMMVRKIQASSELFHWAVGTIDTPKKFEARREHLAKRVWKTMKDNDSLECRNCHDFDAMNHLLQKKRARTDMKEGIKRGKTCIDCHKGIVHNLPEGYED